MPTSGGCAKGLRPSGPYQGARTAVSTAETPPGVVARASRISRWSWASGVSAGGERSTCIFDGPPLPGREPCHVLLVTANADLERGFRGDVERHADVSELPVAPVLHVEGERLIRTPLQLPQPVLGEAQGERGAGGLGDAWDRVAAPPRPRSEVGEEQERPGRRQEGGRRRQEPQQDAPPHPEPSPTGTR